MTIDITKAFEIPKHGVLISQDGVNRFLISSDDEAPVHDAPIGSIHIQSNGDRWAKITAGAGADKWLLDGVGSPVVVQTADMGGKSSMSEGSYLDRAGGIPTNIVGVPITIVEGVIKIITVANEEVNTYTVGIYEHQGNLLNATHLYSVPVVSALGATINDLNVDVTAGWGLAALVESGTARNLGCTVVMKGLAIDQ